MQYLDHYASVLGRITLAGNENALTGLWFDGQKYFGSTLGNDFGLSDGKCGISGGESVRAKLPVFEQAKRWLDIYFSGTAPGFIPPLLFEASSFRRTVWEILLTIPFGATMTYKEIAERIAKERGISHMSAQAVGGAVGHNPISLIVPCHRVVGSDGSLTGYAGGIERKRRLLAMERDKTAI